MSKPKLQVAEVKQSTLVQYIIGGDSLVYSEWVHFKQQMGRMACLHPHCEQKRVFWHFLPQLLITYITVF